ncbi:MAG TPA: ClbS/DfsB family four-helix bundle protein [Chloroflexia bacterium]|nr:ClbS/DfsB family four-helix bundle protein [Chloroflexia bacterium]
METPATKRALVELIQQEHAAWSALIAEVDHERMIASDVANGWTFKDIAAHLVAWRQRAVVRLQAAARGEEPPPAPWAHVPGAADDFEPVNQWILQTNRDRPLSEVLRECDESLNDLETAVSALSELDLLDGQRFPWMQGTSLAETVMGNSCEHYFEEHEPTVRAWLQRA